MNFGLSKPIFLIVQLPRGSSRKVSGLQSTKREAGEDKTWTRGPWTTFMDRVILGDPGAVSRAGRKGATKVFKHRRKSPWVPTLTGPFPKGQANAGSWLGFKNALYYFAQSANSFSWVLFVHDGYYLATVARFVHQAFLTRNRGSPDESKNVSDAINRSNCTEKILFLTDHDVS